MASPKRTKAQREHDLQEISAMYLKGRPQFEIAQTISNARAYGITQQTISRDIRTIQQRWLDSSLVDFNEARAQEIAKLDLLETTYWSQFQQSQEPIVKKRTSKKVDGETTEATQEIILGPGDPRYLQGVERCIAQRCKLLGLEAPAKTEHSGKDGGPLIFTISDFSKAEAELKEWEAARSINVAKINPTPRWAIKENDE